RFVFYFYKNLTFGLRRPSQSHIAGRVHHFARFLRMCHKSDAKLLKITESCKFSTDKIKKKIENVIIFAFIIYELLKKEEKDSAYGKCKSKVQAVGSCQ
ncbi:MAG: hypothetical protein K2H72_05145, partial [Muribaculaceae bacterium]|nr:hypothetical protein [Muribaculaceae bacterium]